LTPSAFNVTATTNDIQLDATRQGSIALTIANISGKPQKGRVSIAALDSTKATWLSVADGTDLTFPVGGAQEVTIQIAVPNDAAAGHYPFRPDVIAVQNPDEDSTQGPILAFEVPAPLPPPPPPPPIPWWVFVAAGVVVLILIGGVVFLLTRPNQPPAVVHAQGQVSIPQTFEVDLDTGALGSAGADIVFEAQTATERFLTPVGGATLAIVGTSPVGKAGYAAAPLSTNRVPVQSLNPGTHVCVKTNEGRFSEVVIVSPPGPSPGTMVI
jgi:hypothetical protein